MQPEVIYFFKNTEHYLLVLDFKSNIYFIITHILVVSCVECFVLMYSFVVC